MAFSKILSSAARALSLPPSILPQSSELTVLNANRLYLDNHRGVLSASSVYIVFDCAKYTVELIGKNMVIDAVGRSSAFVSGELESISFGRKR
ncbi:MAG: YabP/YqfC family sporulation protein [Clostridia bacterium]|nr:YabP/YqfC family sporulation protein [Clostridia bacterium]